MNLQANRCNEFSINGLYLHIYDYDGSGQYYTVKDIRKDLKARGLSKYDLYVIDQYCMLIIDGPVALYTGEYLDWGLVLDS